YPLPYSVQFTGNPQNHLVPSPALAAENRQIEDILSTLDTLDRSTLGFARSADHRRWAQRGTYFLAKVHDQIVAYFCVSPEREIGPLVVSEISWMTAALDLAIHKQWELAQGEQNIFVPGANTTTLAYLLAHGFHIEELNLLLSSHPIPGLTQVVFHDMDLF